VVGRNVKEANLRAHMAAIGKALGEPQFGNRYVACIEGGSYSFVGPVVCIELEPEREAATLP
jgi:DNA-binding winged helix-turn-helix (wHTH) protein